jgi:hypothetical protein
MERPSLRKYDFVQSTLAALLFIVLLGMAFAPHSGLHYEMGWILLSGAFCVYTGLKKIHQARSHERQISWYKQSSLLVGLSLLVGGLPWLLIEFLVVGHTIGQIVGVVMLAVVGLIFFLR